ncbi:MAG TPA: glycosyltransferase family 39 protein [Thermoanaerobaculia bacterium]|nr:glycosyltransferase family 39 protein [Thermoanaerobaculia bacterium]
MERSRWLPRSLSAALLVLFLVRGLLAMRADGTTVDEPYHLLYAQRALTAGTFLREKDLFNSKMPVSVLNAAAPAIAGRGRTLSWPDQLFAARLPTLLLAVLLGCLVWRWAHLLFGAWSATLALFLYTFCPNILAHAHLVTTDLATALAVCAATYFFWRYLERPGRGRLALAAAAFGLAQLTKTTALFLFPIFALIVLPRMLRGTIRPIRPIRALRAAALLLVFALAAILALNLGFLGEGSFTPLARYKLVSQELQSVASTPLLRDIPLPLPHAYVEGLDMVVRDASAEAWSYLHGRYSQQGFRSYFLLAFLVKVPLATQLLLAAALWLWGSGRIRAPGAEDCLLVPVAVLLVYFSLLFKLQIGLRFILPVFPFLFVFAARVAAPEVRGRLAGSRWKTVLAVLPLLWLAASSLSIHPHYLAYFNELAGGPANGWRWLIDSNLDWGQDGEYVRQVYVRRSPIRVFIDPSGPLAGRIAVNVSNLVGWDPAAAQRHAWLRDHFKPIAAIGYSWQVFDVTEHDLAACCAGLPREWVVDDLAGDLALRGEPFAQGDGVNARFPDRLNDGLLGANEPVDAARTTPPQPQPVRASFGVTWPTAQTLGRVVAFPGFNSRGPLRNKFLALDYRFQSWDGAKWRDIPGTRVTGNRAWRVEHRFPPIHTRGIRLVVERERNERGTMEPGGFRAACLELAAYAR